MFEREDRGDVAILRMAYGKANVLDTDMLRGIVDQFDRLLDDPCRAVVLTGTGSIFSAGVDLKKVVSGRQPYLETFLPALDAMQMRLITFPKPIIAAVNGHAIAGGCIIALACDHRLMTSGRGRIGMPELIVGVPFPVFILELVRATVSPQHFQEVVYTGRTYTAPDAHSHGLVDELVEPEVLLDRAVEIASQMGVVPSTSFQITKEQVRRPIMDLSERHSALNDDAVAAWNSEEILDAVAAYVKKTLKK